MAEQKFLCKNMNAEVNKDTLQCLLEDGTCPYLENYPEICVKYPINRFCHPEIISAYIESKLNKERYACKPIKA